MRSRMKPFVLACLSVIGGALVVAQSGRSDFGINTDQLKPRLVSAVVEGYIPMYPNGQQYHAATPAARVAFAKSMLGWMRSYTESSAFQADYGKQRAASKPSPPKPAGTPDDQYAKQLAEQRKSLEEMKKNVAQMSPDMQKQMQPAVQAMEAQLAQTTNNPQMTAMMKQGYAQQAQTDQKNYEKSLQDYETKYPADPKVLIASRLRKFLELSKDIPFDARLVPGSGGKMRFADPQLEAKSSQWKLCFRAGKEPIEVARAFALDWLRQIERK